MYDFGLASDHAGFPLKEHLKERLAAAGVSVKDYGTHDTASCDYPDFAHALAAGMEAGECQRGLAVCGSGEGISMTLNKHQNVRAALVWQHEIAALARQHNDANVLVLPGRFITDAEAEKCLAAFMETPFEGGRHVRRVQKIPVPTAEN